VTVELYVDGGLLALAKRNLNQGLPAAPRKLAGIGSAAFVTTAGPTAAIHVASGRYIVIAILTSAGTASRSTTSLEALAKAIVAGL